MTTQEISRYIAVASNWERKYNCARTSLDAMEHTLDCYNKYINLIEPQLKIQDNAVQKMELEINKLKNHRRYLVCALIGFLIAQVIMGII